MSAKSHLDKTGASSRESLDGDDQGGWSKSRSPSLAIQLPFGGATGNNQEDVSTLAERGHVQSVTVNHESTDGTERRKDRATTTSRWSHESLIQYYETTTSVSSGNKKLRQNRQDVVTLGVLPERFLFYS